MVAMTLQSFFKAVTKLWQMFAEKSCFYREAVAAQSPGVASTLGEAQLLINPERVAPAAATALRLIRRI
jgi:hypothetical protein